MSKRAHRLYSVHLQLLRAPWENISPPGPAVTVTFGIHWPNAHTYCVLGKLESSCCDGACKAASHVPFSGRPTSLSSLAGTGDCPCSAAPSQWVCPSFLKEPPWKPSAGEASILLFLYMVSHRSGWAVDSWSEHTAWEDISSHPEDAVSLGAVPPAAECRGRVTRRRVSMYKFCMSQLQVSSRLFRPAKNGM